MNGYHKHVLLYFFEESKSIMFSENANGSESIKMVGSVKLEYFQLHAVIWKCPSLTREQYG